MASSWVDPGAGPPLEEQAGSSPPSGPGVGVTLEDLRHPDFGLRVWGYDREEVDALMVSVVAAIERMRRRRQRDAAAIEALTRKVDSAEARAGDAERRATAYSPVVEAAEEAASEGQRRAQDAERRAHEAEQRARRAQREARSHQAGVVEAAVAQDEVLESIPLALRASRALLREARSHAAAIVDEAQERARRESQSKPTRWPHDPMVGDHRDE